MTLNKDRQSNSPTIEQWGLRHLCGEMRWWIACIVLQLILPVFVTENFVSLYCSSLLIFEKMNSYILLTELFGLLMAIKDFFDSFCQ